MNREQPGAAALSEVTDMGSKAHWETIYKTKRPDQVSWFQQEASLSLALIRRIAPDSTAAIIDVGGGASTLIDGLLAAGYRELCVLDLSPTALAEARRRVGPTGAAVTWLEADVLGAGLPPSAFDVWHDRAVFHFLIEAADRARYVAQARRTVRPGGYVLVAAFAEDGPTQCSGLPVARYTRVRWTRSSAPGSAWCKAPVRNMSRRLVRGKHSCTVCARLTRPLRSITRPDRRIFPAPAFQPQDRAFSMSSGRSRYFCTRAARPRRASARTCPKLFSDPESVIAGRRRRRRSAAKSHRADGALLVRLR